MLAYACVLSVNTFEVRQIQSSYACKLKPANTGKYDFPPSNPEGDRPRIILKPSGLRIVLKKDTVRFSWNME
jgi:hypothetical protein